VLDVLNKILRTCSVETPCSVAKFDCVVLRRGYLIGARVQEELHRCNPLHLFQMVLDKFVRPEASRIEPPPEAQKCPHPTFDIFHPETPSGANARDL